MAELVDERNCLSASKLLKRINSSCSSGCERRKSVSGIEGRLIGPQIKVIWKWLKYCVANKCPIGTGACANAAENGHLACLKYLHEEAKAPWDLGTAIWAAENGHLHILQYLVERKFDQYSVYACWYAAKYGHLDCLKYLHETAKAPWDEDAIRSAHENNHPECVQYLLDNNCPLPDGWRYEYGELHTS